MLIGGHYQDPFYFIAEKPKFLNGHPAPNGVNGVNGLVNGTHVSGGEDNDDIVGPWLEAIPVADIEVDHSNLLNGVARVVDHFFPDWKAGTDDVKLIECTAGITNKLVRALHVPSGESILVRTYGLGSSVLIDRDQELINILSLSSLGLCPPLHGRFHNGIVYGFIEGTPFSVEDMRDAHKSSLVAKQLALWHTVDLPVERTPTLFTTINKWLAAIPTNYTDPVKDQKFKSEFDLNELKSEIQSLRTHLEALHSPVVFCHNDLLSGNIVHTADTDSVSFIDYEYGAFSYRGFDIGNHFCEWAGFECDWSQYPTRETQLTFLRTYLEHSRALSSSSDASTPAQVSDAEVESLYVEVCKFSLAAHIFWGVWALVQAECSDLDFNYLEYAGTRIKEFRRMKGEYLAL